MTGLEVALVGALAGLGALVGALVFGPSRDRLLRRRARETVVVTMRSGATYKGVLFEADGKSLVLRNAEAWGHNGEGHTPVDGELLLARGDVEFLQRP